MPAPVVVPVWLLWVLGVAAGALLVIITYFLTSSSGKARAARFKEKVLKMVAILKQRLERLERAEREAQAARDAAWKRAREAELKAAQAGEDAAAARAEAEVFREQARRAEAALREFQAKAAAASQDLARWQGEDANAGRLTAVAGTGVSISSVRTLQAVVAASELLTKHRANPEAAFDELDGAIRHAEMAAEEEHAVTSAILTTLRGPGLEPPSSPSEHG